MVKWSYVSESIKCGKEGCTKCPHGPYWYRYRTVNNKTVKEYVGKNKWSKGDPGDGSPGPEATEQPEEFQKTEKKKESPKTEKKKESPKKKKPSPKTKKAKESPKSPESENTQEGTEWPKDWDCIFNKMTSSPELACRILGLGKWTTITKEELRKVSRHLLREHHPDRGGNDRHFKLVNAAARYLDSIL